MIWNAKLSSPDYSDLVLKRAHRITRLIEERGMTPAGAATVVDAAMFGIGCLEGIVRARVEKEREKKS